jgi:chromosome segregation ATPase
MNHSAKIQNVDSLRELHAALAKFGVQAQSALDSANAELRRASDFLERQAGHWQQEVVRRQEELNRAKADLSRQRWIHDGERVGSSEKEMMVQRARERLREAEEKVETVRRWKRQLPQASADFVGPGRRLAGMLEADLRATLALLDTRAAALEAYLALLPPEGEKPS